MNIYVRLIFGVFMSLGNVLVTASQELNIEIPKENIFNRADFISIRTVFNTQGSSHWRAGAINPAIKTLSRRDFVYKEDSRISLSTSVLHWRLASIGGQIPPFSSGDSWPGYKWFTNSFQTWYHPTTSSRYTPGNVDFTFKIPASEFLNNAFYAGDYLLEVTHNYGRSGFYVIEFSPETFVISLSVPWAISWLEAASIKTMHINSLDAYRSAPSRIVEDLGVFSLGNTVDYKLFAKSTSKNIQFTSSKGVRSSRNISLINLGGDSPKIQSLPLSITEKDYTPSGHFDVEKGNKNNFNLDVSISKTDFKKYFFEAGTYNFQINLNAISTDKFIQSPKQIDFYLNVLPLSEITIPNSGNDVNFEFNTASHYQNGQSKIIANQLKISNNETYELYVQTDAAFFRKSGIQSDLPSSTLQVGIDGGQNIILSTTPQIILKGDTPILDENLKIKYTISPSSAQSLIPKEKAIYSINLIYTFTAI